MDLLADIRFGFRTLAKNPGFTAVAVAMLALGIGINATVFTVTDAVLFKGFPQVKQNDRLLYISSGGCCISYPDFEDIRAQAKFFQGMGITRGIGRTLNDGTGFAQYAYVTEVSAGTFPTVGEKPLLGRDFRASDEVPGAASVAILTYPFWVSRYGRDPHILGRTIRMNGALTTIVGVMPAGFAFPQNADMWVPLVKTAQVMKRTSTDTWFAFGRVADGVSMEQARAELRGIIRRLETEYPVTDQRFHLTVDDFAGFFIGPSATRIYGSMWGAVAFVLLIACANLANLLLARALGRSREISIRIALGSGRWRIIRQLLIESLMLAGAGGILGWWNARWGVRTYSLAMAQKTFWLVLDYNMDHRVLAYLIAISIGTGLLFGLAPALRLSKLDVNETLKDGSRRATGGAHGKHLSALLVTGEMALAIVLLAGAGVMIRSFLKIQSATMGVNTADVLAGSIDLPHARYLGPEQQISFFDRLERRLSALPGVASVAMGEALPSWHVPLVPYDLDGSSASGEGKNDRRPKVLVMKISPAYFQTLGSSLLSGRRFSDADGTSSAPVAIVNERLAGKFWPGESPLGKHLRLLTGDGRPEWRTVVGVASDIVQSDETRQRFEPLVYLPYRQEPAAGMWVFVRTRVPPASLATGFRREVAALDPALPMYGPFPLAEHLETYWDSRFYGMLFLIFAAIALLLASIGLYTVIAHSVSRRTQEIGVRMAIGATPRDIRWLVFRQGMLPLGIGLIIGLAASLAVNRLLRSELIQVSPADPVTLLVASGVLILAAMLGCIIPARRAMRVDPVVALRHE